MLLPQSRHVSDASTPQIKKSFKNRELRIRLFFGQITQASGVMRFFTTWPQMTHSFVHRFCECFWSCQSPRNRGGRRLTLCCPTMTDLLEEDPQDWVVVALTRSALGILCMTWIKDCLTQRPSSYGYLLSKTWFGREPCGRRNNLSARMPRGARETRVQATAPHRVA